MAPDLAALPASAAVAGLLPVAQLDSQELALQAESRPEVAAGPHPEVRVRPQSGILAGRPQVRQVVRQRVGQVARNPGAWVELAEQLPTGQAELGPAAQVARRQGAEAALPGAARLAAVEQARMAEQQAAVASQGWAAPEASTRAVLLGLEPEAQVAVTQDQRQARLTLGAHPLLTPAIPC